MTDLIVIFFILGYFLVFNPRPPLPPSTPHCPQNQIFFKKKEKKKPGDIITLRFCITNYDQVIGRQTDRKSDIEVGAPPKNEK